MPVAVTYLPLESFILNATSPINSLVSATLIVVLVGSTKFLAAVNV